jgi:hypothetical protein
MMSDIQLSSFGNLTNSELLDKIKSNCRKNSVFLKNKNKDEAIKLACLFGGFIFFVSILKVSFS